MQHFDNQFFRYRRLQNERRQAQRIIDNGLTFTEVQKAMREVRELDYAIQAIERRT